MTTRTVPTATTSPSWTRIFDTVPAAGDGISTVVLSVAISTSGSSSASSWPSATSQRATSPSVRPSPRSGSLNSYATARRLPGRPDPGARWDDQDAQPAFDPPERERLLVAGQLGRDRGRDVAELERALLVPDRNRVRIVLVRRLRDEREPARRVERRIRQRLRPVGDARSRDDADPWILPADVLTGSGIAELEAASPSLEPEPQTLTHPSASSRRTACTPSTRFTTCVTRRSTATDANASASLRSRSSSRTIRSSIPPTAIFAARPRCLSKPNASHAPSTRAIGHSSSRSWRTSSVTRAPTGASIAVPDTSPSP